MTRRKRNEPIEYEGETYASIHELADKCFSGSYSQAYQTVLRYQTRRNRAVIWPDKSGNMREWPSVAELARHYGLSRVRMRQIINKAAEDEQ